MKLPDAERLKRGRAAVISCQRTDCDICLSACGFSAISRGEGGLPYSDPAKCVGCGGCAAICPDMAIALFKDRWDGTYEVTVPAEGDLPEIGDPVTVMGAPGRVLQTIPQRPGTVSALVRAAANKEDVSMAGEPSR